VARWQELTLIDDEGQLFTVSPEMDKEPSGQGNLKLPRFTGPPNSVGEIFERYNQIVPRIANAGLKIHELGCNARKAWYMILDNGMKLRLGSGESEIQQQRFLKVHNYLIRTSPNYSIKNSAVQFDLRYTNGIAVRTALAE
jgi:cell division protein FtsQ